MSDPGPIKRGDPIPSAEWLNAVRDLCAGEIAVAAPLWMTRSGGKTTLGVHCPGPFVAKITANLGGGQYSYQAEGTPAVGTWNDQPETGTCYSFNLASTVAVGTLVLCFRYGLDVRFPSGACS
jgi:hypothetical protein